MREPLTDEALMKAAGLVRAAMLSSLPSSEPDAHDFSPAFQQHMLKLLNAPRRRKTIMQYTQRVAAVFAAIILSGSLWLTVDASAREAFFQWVREVYENSIVYKFFTSSEDGSLPDYSATWLPDGYYVGEVYTGLTMVATSFTNGDRDDDIYMRCWSLTGDTQDEIFTIASPEPVIINGCSGDYYDCAPFNEANELIWVDESTEVAFGLSGFSDKETLIKIAESVRKNE